MMENMIEKDNSSRVIKQMKEEDGLIEKIEADPNDEGAVRAAVQLKPGDLHSQAMGFWLLGR